MKIINAKVFIDGTFHYDLEVRFDNEKILEIGKNLKDDEVIDGKGNYLYAGFLDAHIHGGFGYSFSEMSLVDFSNGEEQIRNLLKELPKHGVTSCLPTICGNRDAEMVGRSTRLNRLVRKDHVGCDPVGLHYECPYMNPLYLTSASPDVITLPTKEHTITMCDNDLSDVKILCVAPELEGALEWIRWVRKEIPFVEICYTDADSELVKRAADAGLNQVSHMYNGFAPMHHRKNGPILGILFEDRIYAQMMMDNFHVAKDWVRLAIKMKGIDHIYGITDMTNLTGLKPGYYDNEYLGKIKVTEDKVYTEDGTIVGGNLTFDRMMKSARDNIGLSMEEVGLVFAENPCRILNINDRGKIETGRRSDFCLMDKDYNVKKTIIKGEVYYENN